MSVIFCFVKSTLFYPVPLKKYITAWVLLFVYLSSTSGISDCYKIPALFDHYADHCTGPQRTSFSSFLAQHYGWESGRDADADEDAALPFKSSVPPAAFFSLVPPPEIILAIVPASINRDFPPVADQFIKNTFLHTIWQPPRPC